MSHLKHEEIAKLLEGNVSDTDRQRFLAHISQCETCSAVYSDTAGFLEEEGKLKSTLPFPISPKPVLQVFQQALGKMFSEGKYRLAAAAAAVILFLAVAPFVLTEPVRDGVDNARIAHIEANITQLEIPTFSPAADEVYAAIRKGMLLEDLSVLENASHSTELKGRLANLLNVQTNASREMDSHKRVELTLLGRFLERSALATFDGKLPGPQDVASYERIARKHHLPGGILLRLKKMETAALTEAHEEYRAAHQKIAEIIYE